MKAKKDVKKVRNRYSPEFKKQVLDRAEKDGVAVTARDLNLKKSQLYAWRQKRRLEGLTTEEDKLQQSELARLKREVARDIRGLNSSLLVCQGIMCATAVQCEPWLAISYSHLGSTEEENLGLPLASLLTIASALDRSSP